LRLKTLEFRNGRPTKYIAAAMPEMIQRCNFCNVAAKHPEPTLLSSWDLWVLWVSVLRVFQLPRNVH
jgi:hypothetical protein